MFHDTATALVVRFVVRWECSSLGTLPMRSTAGVSSPCEQCARRFRAGYSVHPIKIAIAAPRERKRKSKTQNAFDWLILFRGESSFAALPPQADFQCCFIRRGLPLWTSARFCAFTQIHKVFHHPVVFCSFHAEHAIHISTVNQLLQHNTIRGHARRVFAPLLVSRKQFRSR